MHLEIYALTEVLTTLPTFIVSLQCALSPDAKLGALTEVFPTLLTLKRLLPRVDSDEHEDLRYNWSLCRMHHIWKVSLQCGLPDDSEGLCSDWSSCHIQHSHKAAFPLRSGCHRSPASPFIQGFLCRVVLSPLFLGEVHGYILKCNRFLKHGWTVIPLHRASI